MTYRFKIDPDQLEELILGMGWQRKFEKEVERLVRYQSEDTFMDVWNTKKRVTIGMYDPKTRQMSYHRVFTLEEFEKIITK